MSKILVFGASGQLGTCLSTLAEKQPNLCMIFPAEDSANILNTEALQHLFEREKPAYVINCAAYTAVDKAEDETELAAQVNTEGAENLARLCKLHAAVLVHVSTDFVFEGNIPKLLTEEDPAKPINIYGLTKLKGEQAIAALLAEHFIFRTSWLYSEYGNNFVKTMLRLGFERDELKVIVDQVGTPTYAMDLAATILDVIASASQSYGTYHYSNEGLCSWYDFAKSIFELSGTDVKLYPIPAAGYPTKARRPAFSVMDKTKIKATFNLEIPYWRDSLANCIKNIQSNL